MKARPALRMLRPRRAAAAHPPAKWPPLTDPVDPLDTLARMRAQSLLAGLRYRDGTTNPNALTLDQARDVLAWAQVRA